MPPASSLPSSTSNCEQQPPLHYRTSAYSSLLFSPANISFLSSPATNNTKGKNSSSSSLPSPPSPPAVPTHRHRRHHHPEVTVRRFHEHYQKLIGENVTVIEEGGSNQLLRAS